MTIRNAREGVVMFRRGLYRLQVQFLCGGIHYEMYNLRTGKMLLDFYVWDNGERWNAEND